MLSAPMLVKIAIIKPAFFLNLFNEAVSTIVVE